MKRLLYLVPLLVALSAHGQGTRTTSSVYDAPRVSTTTGLVDWWQVDINSGKLINLFGYNAGAQGWLQLFDAKNGPTNIVAGFSSSANTFTNASHDLRTGQPIQLTGTVAGQSAGIYYVISVDANRFEIASTKANALAGTALTLTGASATATLNKLPFHTFTMGATDNYSVIVPLTGIAYSKGLVVATSTTAATYTADGVNVTMLITLGPP